MRFLSIALPFKQASSTRKGQQQEEHQQRYPVTGTAHDSTKDTQILSIQCPSSTQPVHPLPGLPPSPSLTRPTLGRAKSTPPAATTDRQWQDGPYDPQQKQRRRSFLRSPTSHSSLKHASAPLATVRHDASSESSGHLSSGSAVQAAISDTAPALAPPSRRRRKSLKEIFTLPSSSNKNTSQGSSQIIVTQRSGLQPGSSSSSAQPDTSLTVNTVAAPKTRRRFSFASSHSVSPSASSPVHPTPPTTIRRSLSSHFRDTHASVSAQDYVPPVPPLPAHLSLESISPVYPSKRSSTLLLASPQTPTSLPSSIPGSARSDVSKASSSARSSPASAVALESMTRSSSVPALYTSPGFDASPSSSTGTLATPSTVDVVRNASNAMEDSDHVRLGKPAKQQLSPLLLGPCLSESLLSPTDSPLLNDLHPFIASKAITAVPAVPSKIQEEDSASTDEYGRDDAHAAASCESDEYGIASNLSHGMGDNEEKDSVKVELNTMHSNIENQQEKHPRRSLIHINALRVDTALASSARNNRFSHIHSVHSPSSLSPHVQTFPSGSVYMPTSGAMRSSPPATGYSRTPTPTQSNAVQPTISPRTLSQGARICLDYTMYRLRRDGSASNSTQPEKINMLQNGGRRYPSSTRPLYQSIPIPNITLEQQETARQLRREPRNADMAKELACIGIIKKLQIRKRLTLMEEVELDGFKKMQSTVWAPSPSALQVDFGTIQPTASVTVPAMAKTRITPVTSNPNKTEEQNLSNSTNITSRRALSNTTTSAVVSGAFLAAQQAAWKKWVDRPSFTQRKEGILQGGQIQPIVSRRENRLNISVRARLWAGLSLEEQPAIARSNRQTAIWLHSDVVRPSITGVHDMQEDVSRLADDLPATLAPFLAANSSPPRMRAESDLPHSAGVTSVSFERRAPHDADEALARALHLASSTALQANEYDAPDGKKNHAGKINLGQTLVAKLGFRQGKNKGTNMNMQPSPKPALQALQAQHPSKREEGSSSSSLTTVTISTPSTSASSASSDHADVDLTIQAKDSTSLPIRPEKSSLRRQREQLPVSMLRSATAHLSSPARLSMQSPNSVVGGNQVTHGSRPLSLAQDDTAKALPMSIHPMMVKSHSDQRLSTYSNSAVRPNTTVFNPVTSMQIREPQRRARVASQPEATLRSRLHSMYTNTHVSETKHGQAPSRPLSVHPLHSARPHSMFMSNENGQDLPDKRRLNGRDDDETPLAILKHQNSPGVSNKSQSYSRVASPEPRPRLRSALRSSSQPRPVSTHVPIQRGSASTHQSGPRPHSYVGNRLSAFDISVHSQPNGVSREDQIKIQIREEKYKKEREEAEVKRRQEQRKVWEDHRRRSVYLEEKTAAAEKAAEEANRRHSQLLYSMALNSAAPFPPHPVASLAMWNQASTSTEAKQGNNWHLAQEHAAAGKRG